jgi:hypothetical protein
MLVLRLTLVYFLAQDSGRPAPAAPACAAIMDLHIQPILHLAVFNTLTSQIVFRVRFPALLVIGLSGPG